MANIVKVSGSNGGANCYIVEDGAHAVIIDPGADYHAIVAALSTLTPTAVLATHGHFDHVLHVARLKREYRIPFYLHGGDAKLVKQVNLYLQASKRTDFVEVPTVDVSIGDAQTVEMGAVQLAVLHTPGHTAGSVCFAFDDNLFTGDILMKNSIGRTDLPGGDADALARSLRRIAGAFGDMNVFPGHHANTTLNEERQFNPQLLSLLAS